jgi:uncharacterized membrane protein
MVCNATISFIAIIVAYILVSTLGYNNIPNASFLLLFIAMSGFIELVCSLLGEFFGWIIIILMSIVTGIINISLHNSKKKEPVICNKKKSVICSEKKPVICNKKKPSCC